MGREIRRVPPNWEHPRYTEDDAPRRDWVGEYRPCYDNDYEAASAEWKREFAQWEAGTHPGKGDATYEFWEYDTPPDPDTCRPKFTEEPTWWQVYETVSEGCPVSPAFATREELVEYLVEHGDFWAQKRGTPAPSREAVEAFVQDDGCAPSMIVHSGPEGVQITEGIDSCEPKPLEATK